MAKTYVPMTLSTQELHICRLRGQKGRLYYYQGNFYMPLELTGANVGLVKREIHDFIKNNKELVKSDRASPDYLNILQIFDEVCGE